MSAVTMSLSGIAAALEAGYNGVVSKLLGTVGESFTYALMGFLVSEVSVLPLTALFTFFDKVDGPWRKYKIIKDKFAPKELERKSFRSLIEGRHFLNLLQDAAFYYLFFRGRTQFLGFPTSWAGFAKRVGAIVVIQDIIGYWYHRTVHEYPKLYKALHKQHHEYNVCSIYASFYGTSIEGAFQSYPITYILPYIFRASLFEQLVTRYLAELFNLHEHLGYQFPFDPLNWWPFLGVEFHDYHHSHNKGNYSLTFFRFWDDIFGRTNKTYLDWKAKKAEGKNVTLLETKYEPETTKDE